MAILFMYEMAKLQRGPTEIRSKMCVPCQRQVYVHSTFKNNSVDQSASQRLKIGKVQKAKLKNQ